MAYRKAELLLRRSFDALFSHTEKMAFTETTEDLVRFVVSLGVRDLKEHLDKEVKAKYLLTSSINELLICMTDLFERDLLDNLRVKEFSLLYDESSYQAHQSQMSVMVGIP